MITDDDNVLFFCDRCRKELDDNGIKFEIYNNRELAILEDNYELCEDCSNKFVGFMRQEK